MLADFKDRVDAGRQLAAAVVRLGLIDPLVLALPRGGVPVAAEVARALHAPLDLLIVRKIGAPGQPELAVAAIAEGDPPTVVIDEHTSQLTAGDHAYIKREVRTQRAEIERRCQAYRRGWARLAVAGKTVVVVDDGIATGTTVRAALKALRRMRPPGSCWPWRSRRTTRSTSCRSWSTMWSVCRSRAPSDPSERTTPTLSRWATTRSSRSWRRTEWRTHKNLRHGRFWGENPPWSSPAEAISPKIQRSPGEARANQVADYGQRLATRCARCAIPRFRKCAASWRASSACPNQPMQVISASPGIEALLRRHGKHADIKTPRSPSPPVAVANVAVRAPA